MMRLAVLVCATLALLSPARSFAKADKADSSDPIFPPGTTKHVSDWIQELRSSEDEKVRQKALLAMKLIGPKVKGVVDAVCATMKEDKVVSIRIDAALLLGEFGRSFKDDQASDTKVMVDELKGILAGDSKAAEEAIREAAASSMGNMGRDARDGLPALIAALKDKPKVQTAAAYSIVRLAGDKSDPDKPRIGIVVVDAHEPMMALLKDSAAPVLARCAAARFVAQQEVDGRVTALTDVLADDKNNEARLRKTAADMLGALAAPKQPGGAPTGLADAAVPALAKALGDKDVDLRIAAGSALAMVGPRAKDALAEIRKALKDTDATVRHRAMYVCSKLERDAEDAVPDLISSLKVEKVIENRVAALRALGAIGPPAKDAVRTITDYTTNANPDVRKAATEALAKIQG